MINRPKGAYEPDENDEATHGRKLIYLFCSMLTGSPVASKPSASMSATPMMAVGSYCSRSNATSIGAFVIIPVATWCEDEDRRQNRTARKY